jgi:hypothetical protein
MSQRLRISRREVLRGVGASIALPLLEAMAPAADPFTPTLSPSRGRGQGKGAAPPRLAFVYVPNGKHMADWTPAATGSLSALPPTLTPLQPYRSDVLVLSGLTLDSARAHGDGGGDHARAMAAFLTGRHPHKTNGADLQAGVSVDQLAARRLGGSTRFASLEIGCEGGSSSGNCDHGYSCAYQTNLSWRGPAAPAAKEVDPRLLFERLFGSVGRDSAERERRQRDDKSILDFVAEDARQLRAKVGVADRRKLDEYLSGVRDIEQRIRRVQPEIAIGQTKYPRPVGVPGDFREHLRLMSDLLVLAFQADLTRIASFVFANDGSNRPYRALGVAEGHHDLSHHGGDRSKQAKIQKINRFHVEQLAYLLGKLQAVKEGEGTLLDHCMIVYGSGISDGDRHNHEDLPILLAGKGGGTLKTGRHLRYPKETPLTNLYLSLLDRMGVTLDSFGDSTGRLDELAG